MADFYPIDRSVSLGNQLLNLLERIGSDFAQVKSLHLSMVQQRDQDGSQIADYDTIVKTFGYQALAGGTDDGTIAKASMAEIESFIGAAGPSLEQCAARHRQ